MAKHKHHDHHGHHGHHMHHSHHGHHSAPHGNPDKGPPMHEGAHHFDKGYHSDEKTFSPNAGSGEHDYRGNEYFHLQNEIVHRDDAKMKRQKFSKIA